MTPAFQQPIIPGAQRCPQCGNKTYSFEFRAELTMSTYFGQWRCSASFPVVVDGVDVAYEPCGFRKPWEVAIYDHAAIVPVEVAA